MHSPRHKYVPNARSPITASPSAESAPVPAPTSEEPTRRPFWLRGVVRERVQNHGEFRSGVHHSGHDIICHNRRYGLRELGWCRHLPTPYYRLNGRPIGPWEPLPSLPPTQKNCPCQQPLPKGVESTLPAPAAEGATESPDNPPPDASAAMEVEEEVLTSTAAGGNTRQEAPYTAKDFLLTPSAGATPTNRRKKGKKKPTKKQPPVTASEGTAANIPPTFRQGPPLQWTPQGGTAVQRGVPPDTEGFQEVTTRGARRRARDLAAAAALPVDPAFVGTVLFRTSAPRRNPLTTGPAWGSYTVSTGSLHAADSLLPGIQSAVPVLSAARKERTVTLCFAGPVPLEHVSLFLVRFPVRLARPRPLQCRQCGRFGHVKESCSWPGSCIRCGRTHPGESCKQTWPWCVNCGGPTLCRHPGVPPGLAPAEMPVDGAAGLEPGTVPGCSPVHHGC
ncbi:hypothetical protein MRX96_059382 [Rhipicephalus microplus]